MIHFSNLNLTAGSKTLIEDGNVDIPAGSLTAFIGRNGAGKSTLLRAIASLNRKYSGEIGLGGVNIRSITPQKMARMLAFVTTEKVRVASMRCFDIVAMGRAPYTGWAGGITDTDRKIVEDALEDVGMSDFADRDMQTMSDGECQKIMIARAIAQSTPVILLDEPTSFLDLPGRYALAEMLGRLAHEHGKCILFSTHELDIATRTTDNILLLDDRHLSLIPSDDSTSLPAWCRIKD